VGAYGNPGSSTRRCLVLPLAWIRNLPQLSQNSGLRDLFGLLHLPRALRSIPAITRASLSDFTTRPVRVDTYRFLCYRAEIRVLLEDRQPVRLIARVLLPTFDPRFRRLKKELRRGRITKNPTRLMAGAARFRWVSHHSVEFPNAACDNGLRISTNV
jgi:hypothetical protein